ncbi:MAG: hypothetical protein AAF941_08710 [Pseudomonadota bacterium]
MRNGKTHLAILIMGSLAVTPAAAQGGAQDASDAAAEQAAVEVAVQFTIDEDGTPWPRV